jgi:arabinofuranosyltransferase
MRYRPYVLDFIAVILLFVFALFFAAWHVNFNTLPIEDAAMLMRYAEHFAEGHGIVWNIGEPPVDGATDFLFMISVGMLVAKAGMSLEFATRFLGLTSHILTAGVVYLSLRRVFDAPKLVALGTGIFLIVGPGFYYVVGYFGTTFFALFACISWWVALTIIQNGENHRKSLLFAMSSLITGLIRPEGVFLTGFMMLAIIFIKGWKGSRYTILYYFGVFLVIGGAYFLWRWQYFGYPLPNPYYKKGGGLIHANSLKVSYMYTFFMCLLLLPAFIAGISFGKTFRKTVGFLIPIVGFATCFILLSNDTNILSRFQYATLPVASMVCWPLTQGIRERLRIPEGARVNMRQHIFYSLLVVMLFSGAIKYQYDTWHLQYPYDSKYTVAVMLSGYKDTGLRLATSEAGLLPLYSRLRSVDTWGLNDQWIAHHGRITEEYLRNFDPHIIMFHAYFSPIASSNRHDEWYEMVMVLMNYAEKNGYILAASFGDNPYETEYYYVRSDFPESAEIVRRIREAEYYMAWSGIRGTNYALRTGK